MIKLQRNTEKHGIELIFDSKPNKDVLDTLKSNGFRWNPKTKVWYAKENSQRLQVAQSIAKAKAPKAQPQPKPKAQPKSKAESPKVNLNKVKKTDMANYIYNLQTVFDIMAKAKGIDAKAVREYLWLTNPKDLDINKVFRVDTKDTGFDMFRDLEKVM